jgi:hypothetical protein
MTSVFFPGTSRNDAIYYSGTFEVAGTFPKMPQNLFSGTFLKKMPSKPFASTSFRGCLQLLF